MAPVIAQPLNPESLVARIIAELQANPEAQRLLMRAMLTNEFLGMPARLDRIEKDVAELKADVAVLKIDVAELKTDVAGLKTDVAGLKDNVATLNNRVGYLIGSDLEMKIHRRIQPLLSQHLELRSPEVIQSAVHQASGEFRDAITDAADEGRISPAQEQRIIATDVIVRAQRRRDRATVWVAIEVANRLDREDVSRSRNGADALAAVFGEEAMPVVAGHRIDSADRERAEAAGVLCLDVPERF